MLPNPANVWLINADLGPAHGHGTKMGPRNQSRPFAESQYEIINSTNPGCALDNGIQHRLHVRG